MVVVVDVDKYSLWQRDAEVLAQIGRELFEQDLGITVRLSRTLADQARRSWERDDADASVLQPESSEQYQARARAGDLALIGLDVEEQASVADDDRVVVRLNAWQVGSALVAADELGLLAGMRPPAKPNPRP